VNVQNNPAGTEPAVFVLVEATARHLADAVHHGATAEQEWGLPRWVDEVNEPAALDSMSWSRLGRARRTSWGVSPRGKTMALA